MTKLPIPGTDPQVKANQKLRDQLLTLADQHYGDQHESADQYLFGLLCDLTRMYAAELYEYVEMPLTSVTGSACAEVIGPLIANVCPGHIITDDTVIGYTHLLPID